MAITIDGADNKLEIGANATGPSSLRLYEDTDNGTNYVSIIAPSAVTSNRTLTLPDNTGTILTAASTPAFASTIGVGGATPAASGAGITFPATASASSDANTLDDYEEGTWTPVVTPGGGSLTSYTASGQYTKVGKVVNAQGFVLINTAGTASGLLNLTMPFPTPNFVSGGSGQFMGVVREAESIGHIFFICVLNNSVNAFMQNSTNGGVTWTNNYRYAFSLSYQVA